MTSRLVALPRASLRTTAVTPLHPAPRLSDALGIELWLKRDDLTGFGLGGNKVRGLEYLIGDALQRGCDSLVTGGGPQSNWAMLAALAAGVHGMDAHLVHYGDPVPAQGNHRLSVLAGAVLSFTGDPDRASVDDGIDRVAGELRDAGRVPYVVPRGGAVPVGCAGYVGAAVELGGQLLDTGLAPQSIWLATGSCGTQAGLLAGVHWLRMATGVVGVTVSRPAAEARTRVAELAAGTAELLDLPCPDVLGDVDVRDGHIGPGYGLPSAAGQRAAALAARTEGIFLDPVFAAKAMGALVESAEAGAVGGPVVFLCTGGAPTLFTGPHTEQEPGP